MSDVRFTMIGVAVIFAGFLILGIFGSEYYETTVQTQEFGDCYEYFEDMPPVPVDCEVKILDKTMFFALVVGLIGVGIGALIKGVKGRWDQDVKPEDMLGPGSRSEGGGRGKGEESQPGDSDSKTK